MKSRIISDKNINFLTLHQYYYIYKPFRVLSQFSPSEGKITLKDILKVPGDVYPIGRLDYDSEGLLILTNDKKLNHLLLNPQNHHQREYWVQVEGIPQSHQIEQLKNGILININGKKHLTQKAVVSVFENPPEVPLRNPPIRFRKTVPDTWIRLILEEGKNRQVRRMTAAAGLPTLRLIRYSIEQLTIKNMTPGEVKDINKKDLYNLLHLKADI